MIFTYILNCHYVVRLFMFARICFFVISIESLCWIVSNICITIVKLKFSAYRYPLNPVNFVFTTTLHHITNAASSKLSL